MRKKTGIILPKGWKTSNDAIVHSMTTGKITNYVLNDSKAKTQLLSSAKRPNVNVTKQTKTSTKFSLCTGTYKEVIFPMLDEWSKVDLSRGGVKLNSANQMDVQMISIRHDKESSAKSTQTVVDLSRKSVNHS